LIGDGVNGLVAPAGDERAFVDAALRFTRAGLDWQRGLRLAARESMLPRHWDQVVASFETVLREVAEG